MFWKAGGPAVKMARTSKERWVKLSFVSMPAPSTLTDPLLTVTVPLGGLHWVVDQVLPLRLAPVKPSEKAGTRERELSTPTARPLWAPWAKSVAPWTN